MKIIISNFNYMGVFLQASIMIFSPCGTSFKIHLGSEALYCQFLTCILCRALSLSSRAPNLGSQPSQALT